ncbi:hypothetical protein [Nesterenkonia populi]
MVDPEDMQLDERAKEFGQKLLNTIKSAVKCDAEEFDYTVSEAKGQRFGTLRSAPLPSVQLYGKVEDELVPTFSLELEYRLFLGEFLTVHESSVKVGLGPSERDEPLFRYEYVRNPHGQLPTAHMHVHAHRDEFIHGMLLGTTNRANRRLKEMAKKGLRAELPTLSQIHFPLGGRRLRPGLEDILELLITEFAVQPASERWREHLEAGRKDWRETQLRALVDRNEELVLDELRERGYKITSPPKITKTAQSLDSALTEY